MMRPLLFVATLLALASSASAQEALQPGAPVERTLASSDAHAYSLTLDAGQFVLGSADQHTVDVVVTLTGPDGETIREFDQPARGPEPFQFVTEDAGVYTLTVTPFNGAEGRYTMQLDRTEPVATTPAEIVSQRFAAVDNDRSPGAVVAVLERGEIVFAQAYGMADLTYGIPFTTDTPSNIGSTSKQFTAFAVALLAEQGDLSLDDDVRTHIPELPDFGQTVTLRHLLTHTSGYREYLTALSMAGVSVTTDDIGREDVLGVVARQPELQNAPGAKWEYNNTGYGLLAIVVERVTGTPFQDWMRANVFEPLGMDHTVVRTDRAEIVPGRAMGYVPTDSGAWKEAIDIGGAMGDGGIYTTAGNLLRWMDTYRTASLGGENVRREMTTEAVLTTGDSTGYGLGLFLDEFRGQRRISHSGADIAHRSSFTYFPEIESGVVVLTNSPTIPVSSLGVAMVFFPDAFESPSASGAERAAPEAATSEADTPDASAPLATDASAFDPASFVPETFDAFAGRFELDDTAGYVVTFSREDGRYLMQVLDSPATEMDVVGPARFSVGGGVLEIAFHAAPDGTVETATFYQGGQELPASRIATEAEAIALDDYVGRYYSEELGTVYTARIDDGGLVFVHPRKNAPIPILHGAGERFSGGAPFLTLEFERDAGGQVSGFVAGAARTTGVRFEKMN
ncbi:serine hydrolase [Rubrivirga sp.]|uniref:serine hydrolase n=1 Tax=Rubrivirga sp. TaxID=1885344 RepID=UPI003C70871F